MRGYSHIFVSDPSEATECSDFVAVAEAEQSWQEVFSRARLRELVLGYAKDASPIAIRKANAGEDIWKEQTYRKPSGRIQIVHRRKSDAEPTVKSQAPGGDATNLQPRPERALEKAHASTMRLAPPPMPVAPPSVTTAAWAYPQVSQLIVGYQGGTLDSAADEDWLRQVESKCKGALQQFQLQSKVLTKTLTPNAALLKLGSLIDSTYPKGLGLPPQSCL